MRRSPFSRQPVRSRLFYAGLAVGTIALGLASRSALNPMPAGVSTIPGDALWAAVVFLGLAVVWPRAPTMRLAAAALAIAWGVEASQLLTWPWLEAIRSTTFGRLVLGTGFVWADLVWYTLGVGLAVLIDLAVQRRARGGFPPARAIPPAG